MTVRTSASLQHRARCARLTVGAAASALAAAVASCGKPTETGAAAFHVAAVNSSRMTVIGRKAGCGSDCIEVTTIYKKPVDVDGEPAVAMSSLVSLSCSSSLQTPIGYRALPPRGEWRRPVALNPEPRTITKGSIGDKAQRAFCRQDFAGLQPLDEELDAIITAFRL